MLHALDSWLAYGGLSISTRVGVAFLKLDPQAPLYNVLPLHHVDHDARDHPQADEAG